jgi:ABC-type nickel/cobalt efflux system permease component RcnA
MLIIGLLLLTAVALVAFAAIAGGGGAIDFDVVNNTIESTGTGTFLIGAAAGAALVIGLWMVWRGTRHMHARRREFSRLRRADRTQRRDAVRDRYLTKFGTKKHEPETNRPKDEELVSH